VLDTNGALHLVRAGRRRRRPVDDHKGNVFRELNHGWVCDTKVMG
jgi:hypothetical protein